MSDLIGKKFQHHRNGKIYTVISIADHVKTGEKLVIYSDTESKVWARSYDEFVGMVPRFEEFKGLQMKNNENLENCLLYSVEKQLAEAYEKINEMKCCGNCSHYRPSREAEDHCHAKPLAGGYEWTCGSRKCESWEMGK